MDKLNEELSKYQIELEKIEYDVNTSDNLLANKFPKIFDHKYFKYVNSLDYIKGVVYIFNVSLGVDPKKIEIVKYKLYGLT